MAQHLCLKEPTTRSVGVAKEGKMSKVDIDKLDTDNYAVWSVKMKAYLVIKDLWHKRCLSLFIHTRWACTID